MRTSERIFDEAEAAFDGGSQLRANPYPAGTRHHELWVMGWLAADERFQAENFNPSIDCAEDL